MSHINGIISVYKKRNKVIHLFFIGIIEFFKGGHLCHITCSDSHLLPFVHSIGKHKLQRTAHVKERRVMPAVCFSGLLRLHTSDDIVLSGIFKRKSSVLKSRNDHFVIIIGRKSDSRSGQFRRFDQKLMRASVPYSYRKRRLGQMYMHGCLNTHDRKIICHILSVFVLSACDQILKQTVACKAFCRGGVTAFIQIVQFYPDAVHQLLRKLSGDISVFQILFIVRIHILVKASR